MGWHPHGFVSEPRRRTEATLHDPDEAMAVAQVERQRQDRRADYLRGILYGSHQVAVAAAAVVQATEDYLTNHDFSAIGPMVDAIDRFHQERGAL